MCKKYYKTYKNYVEKRNPRDIEKILSQNTGYPLDLSPKLPYNKSKSTLGEITPSFLTNTNLASIPVDIARGDYVSAGLSAVGMIPVAGEIADTAKIAKVADEAVDAAKAVDKASDAAKSAKKASKITSVADNTESVAKKYNLGKNGYFGTKGKNTQVFQSGDPIKSSADFYDRISKGSQKSALSNGKGVQAVFEDGSRVVYRVITKTPNSPAVSITVTNPGKIKPQKIHFIK